MWWCSTQCHCVVCLLAILLTITDRGPIDRGERTRPSRACLSHEKGAESWRCRRSAACTIATSEAPPERPNLLPRNVRTSFEICLRNWAEVECVRLQFQSSDPSCDTSKGIARAHLFRWQTTVALSYTAFSLGTVSGVRLDRYRGPNENFVLVTIESSSHL